MTPIMRQAWKEYRANNPQSRAPSAIIYVRNSGRTRQKGCILCGEKGPSWCGDYPQTVRAVRWESTHDCSAKLIGQRFDPALAMAELAKLTEGES